MVAPRKSTRRKNVTAPWHAGFLAMLPQIRKYARTAFRYLGEEAKEEAVDEAVANAMVAYVRLFERGKVALAYPRALARFAVSQIRDGRRVGNRLNTREVLAEVAQRRHCFKVERLDRFDRNEETWIEAVVEDAETPVPEQAAFRIDFPAWLASQNPRNRRIAKTLALGHSTGDVAKRFGVSDGRISQLRNEFHDSWLAFHGEDSGGAAV